MKLSYAKPTVTKIGSLTQKTEGGISIKILEVMSRRNGNDGGN